MFRIDGINGESIVIDGVWVEKLRANNSVGRNPADKYSGTDVKEFSRRKKLFGGEREQLVQLTIGIGSFFSLVVPADKRAEIDALLTELDAARKRATT